MFKYIIPITITFSILIFTSCSQSENPENEEAQISEGNIISNQPPEVEVPYPEVLSEMEVPVIDGAYIMNKKKLTNKKNRIGVQVWERTDKSFDDVKAYYLDVLEKNGWDRKTDADKHSTADHERGDAPVKYFVTKFHKKLEGGKKNFVLLINITSGNEEATTVIKILKEM